jgi:hypothetical protein
MHRRSIESPGESDSPSLDIAGAGARCLSVWQQASQLPRAQFKPHLTRLGGRRAATQPSTEPDTRLRLC